MSGYKWTDREISENHSDLECLEAGTISHRLMNSSSTNERRDTIISFCNSEPNISNNTEDLVVDDVSEAPDHLKIEHKVLSKNSLHQNISKSVENNSMNIYTRNGHSSSPQLKNLDYYRYSERMGGGKNGDTFDDDVAKMMDIKCKSNVKKITGLDSMSISSEFIVHLSKSPIPSLPPPWI
jgi:hypothetical protein